VTAFDPTWKNSCMICTELPTVENGMATIEDHPDGSKGMAVKVTLKPGLSWGDGVPVTAKDVVFTVKVAHDPAAGFSNPHSWDRVSTVDIVDERTVVLHFKGIRVDYNQLDELLPEHVEAPIYDKAPGEYPKQTAFNRAPTTPGLWDGPYVVSGYQSGTQIEFSPNPHWPGPAPAFKRIVIRLIENTAALQANLESGDVDLAAGEGIGLTIDQALAMRKQEPEKFQYVFKPSLTYEHIDLQKDNPLLADKRVREALLYATDRQTMVTRLFEGLQPVAATWVNPLDPNSDKDIKPAGFDLPKAKALLAEAGWKPGSDGICRNDKGDRLSLEISTTAGNRLRELIEQVLQNQWKAACVEVTIKNEPPRTLFGDVLKHRSYPGLAMYAWVSAVTESPRRTLGSDNIPTKENNWGGANYIAFSDPQMDKLIGEAESELDPAKQKAIWARMQQIYVDRLPVLPLYFRAEPHVVPTWLVGYTPTGHGTPSADWVEYWHAK
jgi:peptide/nickel transport system substrate-binding protein